jgi:hypothetical protein
MATLSEEITVIRTLDMLVAVPPTLQRLYAFYNRLSHNGQNRVYATAQYIYRKLGISRSTYYAQRKALIALNLISVEVRKLAPKWNAPSLVTVCSLKTIATRLWAAVQFKMSPTNRTQKPSYSYMNKGGGKKANWRPSPTTQWLVKKGLQRNLC